MRVQHAWYGQALSCTPPTQPLTSTSWSRMESLSSVRKNAAGATRPTVSAVEIISRYTTSITNHAGCQTCRTSSSFWVELQETARRAAKLAQALPTTAPAATQACVWRGFRTSTGACLAQSRPLDTTATPLTACSCRLAAQRC